MENSYFIFTDKSINIKLERFHLCSWEFKNSSLVEFGFEIDSKSIIDKDEITISLLIPWLTDQCEVEDLYERLMVADNSRFIFNDSISNTTFLTGISDKRGAIHTFIGRSELCLLPIKYKIDPKNSRVLNIVINLKDYLTHNHKKPNVYIRFWIAPKTNHISVRKKGINKSTIIYDMKINERRNIGELDFETLSDISFCDISTCFVFHILPNNYDIMFLDNKSLKNIRTLEHESFSKYLSDKRIKANELLVVFNKKDDSNSYSFFSVFSKERIGAGQFALAVCINILCGILLFIPSFRHSTDSILSYKDILIQSSPEIWIAIILIFATLFYFIYPTIPALYKKRSKSNKK